MTGFAAAEKKRQHFCNGCNDPIDETVEKNFCYLVLGPGAVVTAFLCGCCREMRTDWQYWPYPYPTDDVKH